MQATKKTRLSATLALVVLSLLYTKPTQAQQFINGGVESTIVADTPYASISFYQMVQEVLDTLRAIDPYTSCVTLFRPYNYIVKNYPRFGFTHFHRFMGFDTLQNFDNGGYFLTVASSSNLPPNAPVDDRFNWRNLRLEVGVLRQHSDMGWSLALNEQLLENSNYKLNVQLNARSVGIRALYEQAGLTEADYDSLNWFKDIADWYIRIGLSDNSNVEGDSIGSITVSNFVSCDTAFFNYGFEEDPSFGYFKGSCRRQNYSTTLYTGNRTGKYLTFKIIAKPKQSALLPYPPNQVVSCKQYFDYQPVGMYLDNFKLGCITTITEKTDTCISFGTVLQTTNPTHKHLWSTGDTTPVLLITAPGTYWVQTNNAGCLGYDTIVVTEINTPKSIGKTQYTFCLDTENEIEANIADAHWYSGSEWLYSGNPYLYVANKSSDTLLLNTKADCEQWDTIYITSEHCNKNFLPTAFSPNNDGLNDVYAPLFSGVSSYIIAIYNRWGEKIYHAENTGWDGANTPQGVYLCVINYITIDGKRGLEKALITLVR